MNELFPDVALIVAAQSVDCVLDPEAYRVHLRTEPVATLIKAAAGLHITTDEYRQTDVAFAQVFGPDADAEAVAMRAGMLAEADQIRAYCQDKLRQVRPQLVALGVFRDMRPIS